MSVRQGSNIIASSSTYHPNLFDYKWADHLLNDVQWLRADTYSWQDGGVYQRAYEHLFNDIYIQAYAWYDSDNDRTCYTTSETPEVGDDTYAKSSNNLINRNDDIVSISGDSITTNYGYTWQRKAESDFVVLNVSVQTETILDTTIQYYQAADGHKIVLPDQVSALDAIYNATGIAWYYILDTINQRFKLPRTKFGFTGLRDNVGNYVEPSLPSFNSVGNSNYTNSDWTMTSLGSTQDATVGSGTSRFKSYKYSFGSSEVVQPAATQMYLYFYVGNFTQTAIQNTAGLNASLFNGKADIDLSNVTQTGKNTAISWLMPDYANGISIATTEVSYTAPSAGWFSAQIGPASSGATISVNGVRVIKDGLPNVSGGCGHLLPVSQSDVITWTPGIYEAKFFPCKGA